MENVQVKVQETSTQEKQPIEKPIKLHRQKNGQYTGSLLG